MSMDGGGDNLTLEEEKKRLHLREEFHRKPREEEIRWKQRLRCNWLKQGDKNTKFFQGMASSRRRVNRISSIMDGEKRLEKKDEIINHVKDYFYSLYADEGWERSSLENLAFEVIGEQEAQWLERKFEEEEVFQAVFDLAGDKAPGPDGLLMAFFHCFWKILKKDILGFMEEFYQRGKLSKGMGAFFIALVRKKV
eukprot:TRINITY_DN24876_c0_g1_i1.p1 TRINITY_DN24876_c0_g1~~TRINITY_DN24876_c0_g1_i1.p1  ORF type:complete len:195 (+),score=47.76 TRINITY_DN24876_c0_g1_i1:421-1005(+)